MTQPRHTEGATEAEREAFEAEMAKRSPGCDFTRFNKDNYANRYVHNAWEGWQARAALSGWISVDERMPHPITYVIAYGRRYGDREGHKRVYVTYTGTRVLETVEDEEIAFWMPLPPAPNQGAES